MTEPYDPRARQPNSQPNTSTYPYGQQWHGGEQWHDDPWWPHDGQPRQAQQPRDQRSQEQWRQDQWREQQWREQQWRQDQLRQEQWRQDQLRQEQWRQDQLRQDGWRQEQPGEQPHWGDDRRYRTERRADASRWHWLLLIPIVVPLITPLYNRIEPKWFGLPFFYWSQLSFALLSTLVMVTIHLATKGRRWRG